MTNPLIMRYRFLIPVLLLLLATSLQAQLTDKKLIRIVDTLSTQEKANRYPVILRSELDSIVQLYTASQPRQDTVPVVTEVTREKIPDWLWFAILIPLLIIAAVLYRLFTLQRRTAASLQETRRLLQQAENAAMHSGQGSDARTGKATDKKVAALTNEINQLKVANEEQGELLIQYQSLKEEIAAAYKIRNYPGYERTKTEEELLKGLVGTERAVAMYAYEHFLKPVIGIADANKNNPARTSKQDREKLLDLLVSLSLLYSEYLYLRVNDLSIGGNMVLRLQGLTNGNHPDISLLKPLNTEHGSRALVVRMILEKSGIPKLTYPVFDETNLNLS